MSTSTGKALENDDGRRPRSGVIVTLLDMEAETSRIILDDVKSILALRRRPESRTPSTHKLLSFTAIDDMALPASEYQRLGQAFLRDCWALNGRVL